VKNNQTAESDINEIVVVGLGYVGLTMAAHLLDRGFKVFGVEVRDEILLKLESGKSFFHEPGLDSILARFISTNKFSFGKNILKSKFKRLFLITVGTPLNHNKDINLNLIINATNQVAAHIKDGDLVVLRSTVMVGTTDDIVEPILNLTNVKFGLAYCPERTLEGAALKELGHLPQIVGANNQNVANELLGFFSYLTDSVVVVSNTRTAEIIKLTDNMQRDSIFAISNHVADVCNNSGVRAKEVIQSGNLGYSRNNLFNAGPVGGPCLEKDSYIFSKSLPTNQRETSLSLVARKVNEDVLTKAIGFIMSQIDSRIKKAEVTIAVLGLAFKGVPETDDLRGSPAVELIKQFHNLSTSIGLKSWDPLIRELPYIKGVTHCKSIQEAITGSDAVILVNNHEMLSNLDLYNLSKTMTMNGLVYDFWDRYDPLQSLSNSVKYFAWGYHNARINK
jgi:UDP-N-acetyl-D-mannosaminuronic acid dehydrogenase